MCWRYHFPAKGSLIICFVNESNWIKRTGKVDVRAEDIESGWVYMAYVGCGAWEMYKPKQMVMWVLVLIRSFCS
jgi:hypothetical protein